MSVSKTEGRSGGRFVATKRTTLKSFAGGKEVRVRTGKVAKVGRITTKELSEIAFTISRDGATGRMLGELVQKLVYRSRRTGKSFGFTVEVDPDSHARVTLLEKGETVRMPGAPEEITKEDVKSPISIEAVSDTDPELEAALGAARERGQTRVAEIMSGPEMLNADTMAARLGVSRMTVNTWREKGDLLGVDGAKRGYRYPDWQLDRAGKPYEELPKLLALLGEPWAVYRFLLQSHGELDGKTGLQALKAGRSAAVLSAAESVGRDFS